MKGITHFPFYRQWTGYSCGAEVLRMGVRAVTGKIIPRREAIAELGCEPDGVHFTRLKKAFRAHGVTVGKTFKPTQRQIIRLLDEGKFVVVDDDKTYDECHVMMLPGMLTRSLVWCADPAVGVPVLRTTQRVARSATEAFTLAA